MRRTALFSFLLTLLFVQATFNKYITNVGTKRQTAVPGQVITLDQGSATPALVEFVALNARTSDRQVVATSNENDLRRWFPETATSWSGFTTANSCFLPSHAQVRLLRDGFRTSSFLAFRGTERSLEGAEDSTDGSLLAISDALMTTL